MIPNDDNPQTSITQKLAFQKITNSTRKVGNIQSSRQFLFQFKKLAIFNSLDNC